MVGDQTVKGHDGVCEETIVECANVTVAVTTCRGGHGQPSIADIAIHLLIPRGVSFLFFSSRRLRLRHSSGQTRISSSVAVTTEVSTGTDFVNV